MNYKNGKIYTIRSHQTDMIYVGSTCSPLYKRLYQHKRNYKNWLNKKYGYTASYEIVKFDDAYIELYEDYPCSSKRELNQREGQLMRETKNCVNKVVAGRTDKEWREDNKEKIKQKSKEYYEENQEKLKQYQKEYREDNKEKIKQYREKIKEKRMEYNKNYYEKTKEKRIQKAKEYREKNKELIKKYRKEYYEKQKNKKKFNNVLLECMEAVEDIKDDNNWWIRLDHKQYEDMMWKFKKYADDNTEKAKYYLETTSNPTPLCNDVLKIVIDYL